MLFFSVTCLAATAQCRQMREKFAGKNLFIAWKDAYDRAKRKDFRLTINGKDSVFKWPGDTIVVDFSGMGIKTGDSLNLILDPGAFGAFIVNKDDFPLACRYIIDTIITNTTGPGLLLKIKEENGPVKYILEQFRWNHWVKISSLESVGDNKRSTYYFNLDGILHPGENKFRIKTFGYNEAIFSYPVTLSDSSLFEPGFTWSGLRNRPLVFKRPTLFEVYDAYGTIVKTGNSDKVFVTKLPRGMYYLNYENKMTEFIIR
jgi:hypothetical protein